MRQLKVNELVHWNNSWWVVQSGKTLSDPTVLIPIKIDSERQTVELTSEIEKEIVKK